MAAPLTIAPHPDVNHPRRIRIGYDDGTVIELHGDGTVHVVGRHQHLCRTGVLRDATIPAPADDATIRPGHNTLLATGDRSAWVWSLRGATWEHIADDVAAVTSTAHKVFVAHTDGRVTTRLAATPARVVGTFRGAAPLIALAPVGVGWAGIDTDGHLRRSIATRTDLRDAAAVAPHLPSRLKDPLVAVLDTHGTLHHLDPDGYPDVDPIGCAAWGLHRPRLLATAPGATWLADDRGHLWVTGWYGYAYTDGLADVGAPGTDRHTVIWQLANTAIGGDDATVDLDAIAATAGRIA